jgi:anti-sigma factor RsiW
MSRMECAQFLEMVSAYADGELEGAARARAEAHVHDCRNCSLALENLNALKAGMRDASLIYNAPGGLQNRINAMLDKAAVKPAENQAARHLLTLRHLAVSVAAVAVLAIGAGIYWAVTTGPRRHLEAEAVADHNRSVMANHLVDIASPDQRKVASWLGAKLNYAPWVPASAPSGLTLIGGRLDVLNERQVATLVYSGNGHTASVFEYPSPGKIVPVSQATVGGLNVATWNNAGWTFVVVSDPQSNAAQGMVEMFVRDSCGTGGQ